MKASLIAVVAMIVLGVTATVAGSANGPIQTIDSSKAVPGGTLSFHAEVTPISGTHATPGQAAGGYVPALAPTGCVGAKGWAQYTNVAGVVLFKYEEDIGWCYGNYKVTKQVYQNCYSAQEANYLGWGFNGNNSCNHSAIPNNPVQWFAQGTYSLCLVWCVKSMSPWVRLQGNGEGNLTGYWYGGV